MKKLMKKRAGFTLVELLIVIIIIGILAGAMLLVAGSGTDKAEATKIISDLRGLKAAALMLYADKPNIAAGDVKIEELQKYMDREFSETNFGVEVTSGDSEWWVYRENISSTGVQNKLADIGEEVGLFTEADKTKKYNTGNKGAAAYMRAR